MEEMGARMLPVLRKFDKTLLEMAWWFDYYKKLGVGEWL